MPEQMCSRCGLLATLAGALLAATLLSMPAAALDPAKPFHRFFSQEWSVESGLPQITALNLVEDREGYLWVATQGGLARFDGHRFSVHTLADTPALHTNMVVRLWLDRDGRLWVGTGKNVARLDPDGFRAIPFTDRDGDAVNAFGEDAEGRLYVGGEHLYRYGDGQLRPVSGWHGAAYSMQRLGPRLWIGGRGRLHWREGSRSGELALPASLDGVPIRHLAWSDGRLWLGTAAGLYRLDGDEVRRFPLQLPAESSPDIHSLIAIGPDQLWVGTVGMLHRITGGRVAERIGSDQPGGGATVISGFQDSHGGVWLGTQSAGLRYVWDAPAERYSLEDGLPDPTTWSLLPVEAGLLIGSGAGLGIFGDDGYRSLVPGSALPQPVAYTLLEDQAGRTWVGTRAGLARFEPGFTQQRDFAELAHLQVNGLYQDTDRAVWVASSGGLYRIDGNDRAERQDGRGGMPESRVRFLLEHADGGFWVGSENGLFHRRPDGAFERAPGALGAAFVTVVLPLSDGRHVVGSFDSGLFVGSADGDRWTPLGIEEGLPNLGVFHLTEHDGRLVVAHIQGVYRIPLDALPGGERSGARLPIELVFQDPGADPRRQRVRCCNGAGNAKGAWWNGSLWLPSVNGVVRVALDDARRSLLPRPLIEEVIHGQRRLPARGAVQIEGGSRDLSIRYTAIDFQDARLLRFRYRLAGFDRDWVMAEERRMAIFTNVPAGRYRFEVQAAHGNESWGSPATVELEVPAHFVETTTFYALLGLATLLTLYAAFRWREQRHRRLRQRLEALVADRTGALIQLNERLEVANRALAEASLTDTLTGLRNRRFMLEQVPATLAHHLRRHGNDCDGLVIGFMLFDIDHFKRVNDSHGHSVGDEVLRRVADVLRSSIREGDLLARWGGEEFLIVLNGVHAAELGRVAERLRAGVGRHASQGEVPMQITCSTGWTSYPWPGHRLPPQAWSAVLELADFALYRAKAQGRDCSVGARITTTPPEPLPEPLSAAILEQWQADGLVAIVGRRVEAQA
jgi:diguanylate cyclase (GGDEF)-like protein